MPVFVDSTNTLKRPGRFTAGGPQKKKQCSDNRDSRCQKHGPLRQTASVSELETLLRCLSQNVDSATVRALKGIGTEEASPMIGMIQEIIERVKGRVAMRSSNLEGKNKMLQAELFLEWLREYDFVLAAINNILRAKVQITVGKTLFYILFHLIDEYISAVDAHQDGWSYRFPIGPVEPYSWVMTLVEEANDSSTDGRSTAAVEQAEAKLARFDEVMARTLRRYKSESIDPWRIAPIIGQQQETLARGCCLLSEQTGYGNADDMGFGLLVTTRELMLEWKEQQRGTASASEPNDSGYES